MSQIRFAALNALDIERLDQCCLEQDRTGELCEDALFDRVTDRAVAIKDVYMAFARDGGCDFTIGTHKDPVAPGTARNCMNSARLIALLANEILSKASLESILFPPEDGEPGGGTLYCPAVADISVAAPAGR